MCAIWRIFSRFSQFAKAHSVWRHPCHVTLKCLGFVFLVFTSGAFTSSQSQPATIALLYKINYETPNWWKWNEFQRRARARYDAIISSVHLLSVEPCRCRGLHVASQFILLASIWAMRLDEQTVNGGNCASYVQKSMHFLWLTHKWKSWRERKMFVAHCGCHPKANMHSTVYEHVPPCVWAAWMDYTERWRCASPIINWRWPGGQTTYISWPRCTDRVTCRHSRGTSQLANIEFECACVQSAAIDRCSSRCRAVSQSKSIDYILKYVHFRNLAARIDYDILIVHFILWILNKYIL